MDGPNVARQIARIRGTSQTPGSRAFAAAAFASPAIGMEARTSDPATRMFDFHARHDEAAFWDRRSTRSGTITYVDDERAVQYVGVQRWVAYRRVDLGDVDIRVGDQLRITARGSDVGVESIGPNRLGSGSGGVRTAISGMVVLRVSAITHAESESLAQEVAARGSAALRRDADGVCVVFRGDTRLHLIDLETKAYARFGETLLLSRPVAGALRLVVAVRSDQPEAAFAAERALVQLAAMIAAEAECIAIDDSGAIFSGEQLYGLATRSEMRADSFDFASGAAQRDRRPAQIWFSERNGVCDELVVFSSRPWCAEFAAMFLRGELDEFADAARESGDPCVPATVAVRASAEPAVRGSLERLITLSFATVDIDVSFLDVRSAGADLQQRIDARQDISVMLNCSAASAIVIAYGNAGADCESKLFALEMRRAEAFATALAAAFVARDDAIATDVGGALYSREDLQQLARRRCGKSRSWTSRVAAFRLQCAAAALDRDDRPNNVHALTVSDQT